MLEGDEQTETEFFQLQQHQNQIPEALEKGIEVRRTSREEVVEIAWAQGGVVGTSVTVVITVAFIHDLDVYKCPVPKISESYQLIHDTWHECFIVVVEGYAKAANVHRRL